MSLDGRRIDAGRPGATRCATAIGFVSSKRGEESLAANLAVRENLFINPVATGKRRCQPIVSRRERARRRARGLQRFSFKAAGAGAAASQRSRGGNQQKVVVARWMEAKARLLVLEEPTFGVDVGSKAEIYRLLQRGAEARAWPCS